MAASAPRSSSPPGHIDISDAVDEGRVPTIHVIEPDPKVMANKPPSQVLLHDIYPTGSCSTGLPICVMNKLQEQVALRDPADSGFDFGLLLFFDFRL